MSVQPGNRYDLGNEAQFRRGVDSGIANNERRLGELENPTLRDLGENDTPILPAARGRMFVVASQTTMTMGLPTGGRPGVSLQVFVKNSGVSPWVLQLDPNILPRSGWVNPTLAANERFPLTLVCLENAGWMAY